MSVARKNMRAVYFKIRWKEEAFENINQVYNRAGITLQMSNRIELTFVEKYYPN